MLFKKSCIPPPKYLNTDKPFPLVKKALKKFLKVTAIIKKHKLYVNL